MSILLRALQTRLMGYATGSRPAGVGLGFARVDDVSELPPQEDDQEGRTGEGEPERRGDAERPGEKSADWRPDDEATHDRHSVDAPDSAEKLVRDRPLPDDG